MMNGYGESAFVCDGCQVGVLLGVYTEPHNAKPGFFQLADAVKRNWANQPLSKSIWKFLAHHTGHPVGIRDAGGLRDYLLVGRDDTIESYINGWPSGAEEGSPR
ncbi:hypothetical protein HDA40_007943 [Hamadaea flava]|uniref:Uncharacterized protein n=1 Tax=Hamadaea flava TaxID=1742688 RepID=A0ABV8LZL1_9ACTN|nr:hypothetical protein [Hamadaea flava]MCP2329436.1 hypothetical protein [Hamadaea flava]